MPISINYEQALKTSKEFLKAAKRANETRLASNDKFDTAAVVPAIVCVAFSIEAGIKAILFKQTGNLATGHELDDLFNKLNQQTKNAIEKTVPIPAYPSIPGETKNLQSELVKIKHVFIDWRYIFEHGTDTKGRDKRPNGHMSADFTFMCNLANAIHNEGDKLVNT